MSQIHRCCAPYNPPPKPTVTRHPPPPIRRAPGGWFGTSHPSTCQLEAPERSWRNPFSRIKSRKSQTPAAFHGPRRRSHGWPQDRPRRARSDAKPSGIAQMDASSVVTPISPSDFGVRQKTSAMRENVAPPFSPSGPQVGRGALPHTINPPCILDKQNEPPGVRSPGERIHGAPPRPACQPTTPPSCRLRPRHATALVFPACMRSRGASGGLDPTSRVAPSPYEQSGLTGFPANGRTAE